MSVRSPTAGTWSSSQWRPDNEFETDSRVAVLLTEGKSLREVAAATGCKETTIRWHLRQIFAKRGIARQAELVRLVLSLAGAAHVRR